MDSTPAPPEPKNTTRSRSKLPIVGLLVVLVVVAGILWWKRWASETSTPATTETARPAPLDVPALQAKADGGDKEAQFTLAGAYTSGNSVTQDFALAASWYRKAAGQNHAKAQTMLGELHEAGQGVKQDYDEALRWYQRAANGGEPGAQYNLAVIYAFGRGVPKNPAEAVKWYTKAAENGEPLAQYNIGQRYQLGKDVPQDNIQAYKWLHLAHANGIVDARRNLTPLESTMSKADIAEAKRRAALVSWKK